MPFKSSYTDDQQREHVKQWIESDLSRREYARQNDLSEPTMRRWCAKWKHNAIDSARLDHQTIDGHYIKKATTHYDGKGNIKNIWLKTDKKLEDSINIIQKAVEAFKKDIPQLPPRAYRRLSNQDLLSLYITTDYHFGLLAQKEVTGEDWNLETAKDMLIKWYASAIDMSPNAHTGVLCNLGDLLHFDSLEAITPTSGHVLDADSKYQVIVGVVIETMRQIIDMMLSKHEHVHIIMAEGNHDIASSVWLRALFAHLYANEPRITVDNTHIPYYGYQWGDISMFFHHGHKRRVSNILDAIMVHFREMVGNTKQSIVHMGDKHHKELKEHAFAVVEQHATLCPTNDYEARGGWGSGREACVITYHKEFGEVSRNTIKPEMIM